jgi:hypothetical protein
MKKLSHILNESYRENKIKSIDTKEKFINWVNEELKNSEGYTEELSNRVSLDLLEEFNGSFADAIEHFKNFQ